jgi:hypothetical protein
LIRDGARDFLEVSRADTGLQCAPRKSDSSSAGLVLTVFVDEDAGEHFAELIEIVRVRYPSGAGLAR